MRLLRYLAPVFGILAVLPAGAQTTPPKPVRMPRPPAAKGTPAKDTLPKPAPVPDVPKYGYLQGVAFDSIHGEPLAGALIQVEGTGRLAPTDSLGRFLIDSVAPGSHRLLVDHALLDTLGISLVTPAMQFEIGGITRAVLAVPEPERLAGLFCASKRALGPGALVGRIREPDTDEAAAGARVSFVWYDPDPPGVPSNLRVKKQPRVREATVTADGTYRICGLPLTYEGKLQAQRKDGGATAEVTVSQSDGVLALRSMSVAALPVVASNDTGAAVIPKQKGSARVFGRVVNASGAAVSGARVDLMGTSASTRTRTDGSFLLDSLPSGTQAVVVRQFGYKPYDQTVELSSRTPARVDIKLGVYVPELTAVEVVSVREEGLQRVGFLDRKRSAVGGHFLDSDFIEKQRATRFTDLMRTQSGIRVVQQGQLATLTATRSATGGGCVVVYVDGGKWESLEPGDLDSFVSPNEVAAIEVYATGSSAPAEFSTPGGSCASVVVWTKTRVDSRRKK